MTVEVGSGGKGTSAIQSSYPITQGDQFGTTKTHTKRVSLKPTKKSLLSYKDKVGI